MAVERAAAIVDRQIDTLNRFEEMQGQCRKLVAVAKQTGGREAALNALDAAENEAESFDDQMRNNFLGVLGDLRRQLD